MRELHDLGLAFCDNLSDISPVFALQNLHSLWLNGPNIESIQGVQNLTQLCRLDISDTRVSDLSPLAEADSQPLKVSIPSSRKTEDLSLP